MVQLNDPAQAFSDAAENAQPLARRTTVVRIAGAVFVAGAVAILVVRWWTGTGYLAAPAGLPDPGQLTAIAMPVAHLAGDAAGMVVVGLLLVRLLSPGAVHELNGGLLKQTARWSWVWAGSTAAWIVFTASDMTGMPVGELPGSPDLLLIVSGTQRVLAQIVTLWVAIALAMYANRFSSRPAIAGAGFLALLALLPSALTGHAGHHNETVLTVLALAVHVVAAGVWVGGLLGIVLYLRHEPVWLAAVLPKFSATALVCAAAVAGSGLVVSVVMLGSWSALLESPRGHLVLVKAAALLLLVVIGYLHRRTTVRSATRGDLLPLLRLAGLEVLVMGATIGVAVALSTTA